MQTNLITGYTLSLVGPEIRALEHIIQAAREAFTAAPPPHLRDAAAIAERIADELDLPDVPAPAAPAPLLLEAPVEEATPAELIEAPAPAGTPWRWELGTGEMYWFADAAGAVWNNGWAGDRVDRALLQRGNVYRTREEAEARARLDDELALSAHLRQLGGGDSGRFAVRYDEGLCRWGVLGGGYDSFSPGEARFESFAVAVAARDKLRAAGLLPREQLAPVAAGAPAEVPSDTPSLNPNLRHAIMVLLLTPPGWPAPPEVWEAIHMAAKGPQS